MATTCDIARRFGGGMSKGAGRATQALPGEPNADCSSPKEIRLSRGAVSGSNAPSHVDRFNG